MGGLVALLIDIPRAAGASALSGLAAASVAMPSLVLALAGVAVGLVLTLVTGRFELNAKRQYLGILEAMGWNPDMLRQVRLFENALVGTVALPLGVLGALGIGLLLARMPRYGPASPASWLYFAGYRLQRKWSNDKRDECSPEPEVRLG
ncbi:hypothetical protein AHiyo4_29960 [Arthrobacter sp. Hiyo4]|nr:hypothetical protein AHiyo4_29960 [Arthrobacter sp. Hiyo4]